MGLSARRQKQRIPKDPRNLGWVDDAARFGQNYLSKLGWDPSKGLGIAGDGRTDHIKVIQKQDTLGIGVSRARELDGTAWKQNTDFEDVLKRLNDTTAGTGEKIGTNETRDEKNIGRKGRATEEEDGPSKPKKKKRKITEPAGSGSETSERRKEKATVKNPLDIPSSTPVNPTSAKIIPRRAYRARVIASKELASKSTVAISEILGVAPSSFASSPVPPESLPSLQTTTSTASVADYFQAKLAAKSRIASIA